MRNFSRSLRRHVPSGTRLMLALVLVGAGLYVPGTGGQRAAAQAVGPCALLTAEELAPLAPSESVAAAIPTLQASGFSACQYAWGEGVGRYTLGVAVNDATRMYAGMGPDQIKQRLQALVLAGTHDSVVPDVGELAVFKAESPAYVHASAYLKGRVVQVLLSGVDARDKQDQVIAVLKSAASRL